MRTLPLVLIVGAAVISSGCTDYYTHEATFPPASVLNVTATAAIAVDFEIIGETKGKGCAPARMACSRTTTGQLSPVRSAAPLTLSYVREELPLSGHSKRT